MPCPDAQEIELYACGKLDGPELGEFEAHLKSCSECQSK